MQRTIETDRLILRPLTEADGDDLADLNADPDVMFFINGGRAVPREDTIGTELPRILAYGTKSDGYGCWAAIEKASGAFLGWIMLHPARDGASDEPELGYRLHKQAWDKGYATEGSQALIEHAFSELGARRIFATTMTVNAASRRVMEKSGLRFVRTFFQDWPDKIPGDELGDVEYALDRAQWEADRAAQ